MYDIQHGSLKYVQVISNHGVQKICLEQGSRDNQIVSHDSIYIVRNWKIAKFLWIPYLMTKILYFSSLISRNNAL